MRKWMGPCCSAGYLRIFNAGKGTLLICKLWWLPYCITTWFPEVLCLFPQQEYRFSLTALQLDFQEHSTVLYWLFNTSTWSYKIGFPCHSCVIGWVHSCMAFYGLSSQPCIYRRHFEPYFGTIHCSSWSSLLLTHVLYLFCTLLLLLHWSFFRNWL